MTQLSDIFAIQDRTGTVAQLTLDTHPTEPIDVGDTGVYTGPNWEGRVSSFNFTVCQIITPQDIAITTMTPSGAAGNVMQSGWPKHGFIQWVTGGNTALSPGETPVLAVAPANAYVSVAYFEQYHRSRGNEFPDSPADAIEHMIVQSTDYLDARYRFKGIKLLQFLTDNPAFDPSIGFLDPWLALQGFAGNFGGSRAWLAPSFTTQKTEWPRQGVIDSSGDNVVGIPEVIKRATCELALRALSGTTLQPDFDPSVVTAGGVLASKSVEVGPIKKTLTYDTKLGLGFFPSYPQVSRMLKAAGVLASGGGRSITR